MLGFKHLKEIEIGKDFINIYPFVTPEAIEQEADPLRDLGTKLMANCDENREQLKGSHSLLCIFDNHHSHPGVANTELTRFHPPEDREIHFHIMYPGEYVSKTDLINLFEILGEELSPALLENLAQQYHQWLAAELLKEPSVLANDNVREFCEAIYENKDPSEHDIQSALLDRRVLKNDQIQAKLIYLNENIQPQPHLSDTASSSFSR